MIISDLPQNSTKSERGSPRNQQICSAKIIDFFAAREALRSEARFADQRKAQLAKLRAEARQQKHLFDLFENMLFLLLLIAAAVLGVLAISGFG